MTTAVNRRLPGGAEPRTEALASYNKERAKFVGQLTQNGLGALAPVLVPDAETVYRWRVQLDCGCIHEVFTTGNDELPQEQQWRNPQDDRPLPAGQMMCWHQGERLMAPHREIVEWGERDAEDWPPDPIDPPEGSWMAELSADRWAKMRHAQPRAGWEVTLSCGHFGHVIVDDLNWTPADGPVRREVPAEELTRHLARFDAELAEYDGPWDQDVLDAVEHGKRWWSDGCPTPSTDTMCHTCDGARRIVAYQRVGWLVPRPKPKRQAQPPRPQPSRATVKRQLREAEREADRLRELLATLDADPPGSGAKEQKP